MLFKKISLLSLVLIISIVGLSQSKNLETRASFSFKKYDDLDLNKDNFFKVHASKMRLSELTQFKLQKAISGIGDLRHYRYKQYYKNVPVYGMSYILHEQNGKIIHSNGNYLPQLDLPTQVHIDKNTAIKNAMRHMQISSYDNAPKPVLHIIDAHFPKKSDDYKLVYVFELVSKNSSEKWEYIIDAQNGAYLNSFSTIFDIAVEAKGLTSYYGEKSFMVDSLAPDKFRLHDSTRGNGITTYTEQDGSVEEIHNSSNFWDLSHQKRGSAAIDVHWATQGFYDMLNEKFEWNGLDNAGRSMNSIVHANGGQNFVNATWDGSFANFGDGDCNFESVTAIEIVGHEFTHGIISETANLIYQNESGAINESLADVMGKALEYHLDKDGFSWLVGDDITTSPFAEPIRNMANPLDLGHPAFYKGFGWMDGAGVHTNSSIGNLWFQILVDGKTGVNELGETYEVSGIGMDNALDIVFTCLTSYLTENSNYPAYYYYSLEVAENIFGENSNEFVAVQEAWKAVGLNDSYNINNEQTMGLDLAIQLFSNQFSDILTCVVDDFVDLEILVINRGSVDFIESFNGSIKIENWSSGEYNYLLNAPILKGDTLRITLSDYLFIESNSVGEVVSAYLKLEDDARLSNNDSNVYINNTPQLGLDVNLDLKILSKTCVKDGIHFQYSLRNESCEILPKNTEYSIEFYDEKDALIYTINSSTVQDLTPYEALSANILFTNDILDGTGKITAILNLSGDMNEANNLADRTFNATIQFNNQQFLASFSSGSDIVNNINYSTSGTANIVEYNGEKFYGTTGSDFNLDSYCYDPLIFFYEKPSIGGLVASIELCLDLKEIVNPALKFDLVQFRDIVPAHPDLLTSICKLSFISENDFFEELFYDLEEGEIYNYTYPLANNFKGEILFQFYNRNERTIKSEYFEGDVFLLDNLEITGLVPSNELSELKSSATLFPNPVENTLNLKLSKTATNYSIMNAQGIKIKSAELRDLNSKIDLTTFSSGYYILHLEYSDNDRKAIPFIHLEP